MRPSEDALHGKVKSFTGRKGFVKRRAPQMLDSATPLLTRPARRGIPAGSIRLFFEGVGANKRLRQIGGIVEHRRHQQIHIVFGAGEPVEYSVSTAFAL